MRRRRDVNKTSLSKAEVDHLDERGTGRFDSKCDGTVTETSSKRRALELTKTNSVGLIKRRATFCVAFAFYFCKFEIRLSLWNLVPPVKLNPEANPLYLASSTADSAPRVLPPYRRIWLSPQWTFIRPAQRETEWSGVNNLRLSERCLSESGDFLRRVCTPFAACNSWNGYACAIGKCLPVSPAAVVVMLAQIHAWLSAIFFWYGDDFVRSALCGNANDIRFASTPCAVPVQITVIFSTVVSDARARINWS